MKVGIVTFTQSTNYGQRLQNYAVDRVLRRLGAEPKTLMLTPDFLLSPKLRLHLKLNMALRRSNWQAGLRMLRFDAFNKQVLDFAPVPTQTENASPYDFVVCGSDQIWNMKYKMVWDNLDYFFASFVPSERRIAYSASIGVDSLTEAQSAEMARRVEAMKAVSVRERAAQTLLNAITDKPVLTTLDPVFMLTSDEWAQIARRPKYMHSGENYILTYFLGAIPEKTSAYIRQYSEQTGMRVVALKDEFYHEGDNLDYFVTDPAEFVWLIANSAAVFSDSFHGCAFSCIFRKAFRWFSRSGGASMNSRLDNIFKLFSISDWAVGSVDEPLEQLGFSDFSGFDAVIDAEREKALSFLRDNLQ